MEYQEMMNVENMNNNMMMDQQQFNQYSNNNFQQQFQPKPRGLNLYQIPIFEIYNPKNATVVFQVDTKSGELSVIMAPAIPNNPAINQRGPVQKGTVVYDYSKKVVSNFSDIEVIDLIYFLKDKFLSKSNNQTNITNTVNEIKTVLMQYQVDQNLFNAVSSKLDTLLQNNNSNNDNNENQIGMYRKRPGYPDRVWNFVFDPSYNMLHINVTTGQDKIRTTLSAKMSLRLLSALESYSSNYATIKVISEIAHSMSKSMAFNNLLAPNKEQIKELD